MRKTLTALVITPEPAWPVRNGSDVRIHQLIRSLAEFSEFDIATLAPTFVHVNPEEARRQLGARSISVVRHSPPLKQIVALKSLATSKPMGLIMYRSEPMRNIVAALSAQNRYDVCLIFGGFCMAAYAADAQARRLILDMSDDAAMNKERRALVAGNSFARAFYRWQAKLIRSHLRKTSPAFARILASSPVDAASISRYVDVPVIAVPNSVNVEFFRPAPLDVSIPHDPLLLFVGAMNYRPNRDAVRWFTSSVLPLIIRQNSGTRLQLAGPGSDGETNGDPSIVSVGFAENLADEYRKCDVFVCPLRVGTGIKNKMLEALSSGCAIVSTGIGIEGLDVRHEEHLLVANDPFEFAAAVKRLLSEPELRNRLGRAARFFAEQFLSPESVGNRVRAAILPEDCQRERHSSKIRTAKKNSVRQFDATSLRDAME